MKKLIIITLMVFASTFSRQSFCQNITQVSTDTTAKQLNEVVVIGKFDFAQKQKKVLSSLDSYLESNPIVNMLKRGAYAWEPLINGMSTERSIITIDGMRIYGACTDKMDPITSYIEITNLSKVNIQSGQSGAKHGATIAGSMDLLRSHSDFDESGFKGTVLSGWESNNMQKIVGSKLQYAGNRFFTDVDFMLRDAKNYKAGGSKDVLYSQFSKYNISATAGLKINDHQNITAAVIYDNATDVGYPALTMDVSSAKATIASLEYIRHHISSSIKQWESKIYFNQITHVMDDTQRPFVPVRMDMPGWSSTAGFYSVLKGEIGKHQWDLNFSGHFNKSLAEMTMYSNNSAENDMFMLTWPGVHTYVTSFFLEDKVQLNDEWLSTISIGSSLNDNVIKNQFGYESLKIFYPNMNKSNIRWLKSIGIGFSYNQKNWVSNFGVGFGDRAPSISEGYGFYLFNSMDNYDYIGNPEMKNEKSLNFNASSSYGFNKGFVKAQVNYFRIYDYIIGIQQPVLLPMTIGAKGIKKYEQMQRAKILNTNISVDYTLIHLFRVNGKIQYSYGQSESIALPQIQPFSYGLSVNYTKKTFSVETSLEGALEQNNFGSTFGEIASPSYSLLNASVSNQFQIANQNILIKTGVENIFDKDYRTFADWNNIPRMGRNYFINLVYKF